jgi:predicted hydrocarbon binding protein
MPSEYVRIKPSVIVRFVNTMEAYVGSFARDSFYKICKQSICDIVKRREKTNLRNFLKEFDINSSEIKPLEDLIVVEVKESAFAKDCLQELGRFGRPVCIFVAACLAGAQTAISGKQYDCMERKCLAIGDDFCQFVLYPSEKKWEMILEGLK